MMYGRIDLVTHALIGTPGNLPSELVGLANESLADLSWVDPSLAYSGIGYWPLEIETPQYDSATQELTDGHNVATVDAAGKRLVATRLVRARPAVIRTVAPVAAMRFTVAAGVVTVAPDSVGLSAISRISIGRYRVYFAVPMLDTNYFPQGGVQDIAALSIRATARTTAYVELRTATVTTAVATDAAEVFLTISRIT
jgi:hypothetical protein